MKSVLIIIFSMILGFCFAQAPKKSLKKYPKEVQKIIDTEAGVFRGSAFGDSKASIKEREKVALQAETDTTLVYTMPIDANDSADLLYYLDSTGNARSFAVVFILQDVNEEKNLKTSLIKYYSERYGKYTVVNEEDELWKSAEGYLVEMKDTSDEAGMEIEIVYYKK